VSPGDRQTCDMDPVPSEHVVTAADGSRIACQLAGSGPALLLLAGQANDHGWWGPVRRDFEAGHTTITLDCRGTGASDRPREGYSTRGFAADAAAVLAGLGIDRADVYGTSMGGRVAQWLAIEHPDRVARLVLGCTAPGGPHSIDRGRTVRRGLAQPGEAGREFLLDLMYTPAWRAATPGPYPVVGDPSMPAHARAGHLLASHRHDAWDRLPEIGAPTLIVHGTEDLMTPVANAGLLAARIPDSRVELIEGARHAYFHEFRERAGTIVLDFLAG